MFTHSQLSELITAIKGRGEIPLKFNYIGKDGTKRWDSLAKLRGDKDVKGINKVEADLLSTKANDFLHSFNDLKKLNIIDIGPGNGFPVTPLLDTLIRYSVEFRYGPVDISDEMLEVATKNVKNLFPKISIKSVQLDFELGNFAETTYKLRSGGWKNLLVFLGTTLGNQSDRSRILTNFRDSMTSEDFLIIGVELVNLHKIDKLLEQYHVKQSRDFTFTTAEHIGIKNNEGEFEERFNNEIHAVEEAFNTKPRPQVR